MMIHDGNVRILSALATGLVTAIYHGLLVPISDADRVGAVCYGF